MTADTLIKPIKNNKDGKSKEHFMQVKNQHSRITELENFPVFELF